MSITRTPACRVKFCPYPRSPEFHQCWCGKLAVEHHDIVGGGMGGGGGHHKNPETIICLCHEHHEGVTIGGYKDAIEDGYYVVRNRKGQRVVRVPMRGTESTVEEGGATTRYEPHPGLPKTDTKMVEEGGAMVEAESAAAEKRGEPARSVRSAPPDTAMPEYASPSAAAPSASGESSAGD